jgi:hypothetical protein
VVTRAAFNVPIEYEIIDIPWGEKGVIAGIVMSLLN